MTRCPICESDIEMDAQFGDTRGLTIEVKVWCLDEECKWAGGSTTIFTKDVCPDLD
jgi:hypothetical protein